MNKFLIIEKIQKPRFPDYQQSEFARGFNAGLLHAVNVMLGLHGSIDDEEPVIVVSRLSEENKMDENKFQCGIQHIWVTMNDKNKFITLTTYNESRDGLGKITIALTSPWMNKDYSKENEHEKVIVLDSIESFEKFWDALMSYDSSKQKERTER